MIGPALPSDWKPPAQERAASDTREGVVQCKKGVLKQMAKAPLPAVHLSWEGGQGPTVGCGLRNLGNSCYLNSVLQCLAYVPPLGRRCMERQHSSGCPRRAGGNVDCAACLLEIRLARNLEMGPTATEGPVRLWKNLHLVSKELRRGSQEDAHEALRVMVEAWNRDTLRGIRGWNLKPPPGEKEPTTPISQLFGGEVQSQVRCLGCGHESNTTEAIMDLSLDVDGCRTLLQALKRFTAAESLDGDNKYRCDKCRRLVAARKQMTVRRAPHCLVVHLKRFDFMGGKLKHPVAFGETLSLAPFMSSSGDDDEALLPEFHLSGVVVHQGSTRNHGHYHAFIRDGAGTWYDMDDSCVTRATRGSVLAQPAYLLFYSRRPPTTDGPVNVSNHNGSSTPSGTPAAASPAPPAVAGTKRKTFIGPPLPSPAKASKATGSSAPDTNKTLPATAAPSKSPKASAAARTPLSGAPLPSSPSPREAAPAPCSNGPDSSRTGKPPQRAAAKQSIWMTSVEAKKPIKPGTSRIRTAVASGGAANKAAANGGLFSIGPTLTPADHQGSAKSAVQPSEDANGALRKRRKVDGGDSATRQAKDRERIKALVRSWCLQGPLASTYAAAKEAPADSPEFGKLRARAQKAASTNPEALLGTEKYRQALGEVDSLLPP